MRRMRTVYHVYYIVFAFVITMVDGNDGNRVEVARNNTIEAELNIDFWHGWLWFEVCDFSPSCLDRKLYRFQVSFFVLDIIQFL